MASEFYNMGGRRHCFWTAEDTPILARALTKGATSDAVARLLLGRNGLAREADERVIRERFAASAYGFTPVDVETARLENEGVL